MSKKRKLDFDPDELIKKAKKLHEEKSENLVTKPFSKFLSEENFNTLHIKEPGETQFKEVFGREYFQKSK